MATVRAPERPARSAASSEQSRARFPDLTGVAERAGGRIAWEAYGAGEPPIVFVPPWQIVHSRVYKAQIPDFARRHRVIAWDHRGNGRSDRPTDPTVHTTLERAANLEAVMDAAAVEAAVLVGLSGASGPMLVFTDKQPERVLGLVFICPASPLGQPSAGSDVPFEEPLDSHDGWNKENIHFWRRDFRAYLEHFFEEGIPEPHSTKQREDGIGWGLDTDPESLAATVRAPRTLDVPMVIRMCAAIRCPVLVIQGTEDQIGHVSQGIGLAAAIPGASLILMEGAGHVALARHPIRINLAIREFIRRIGGGSDGDANRD
jgi:pimeloyl-ACP methyl ester carboxylesterase